MHSTAPSPFAPDAPPALPSVPNYEALVASLLAQVENLDVPGDQAAQGVVWAKLHHATRLKSLTVDPFAPPGEVALPQLKDTCGGLERVALSCKAPGVDFSRLVTFIGNLPAACHTVSLEIILREGDDSLSARELQATQRCLEQLNWPPGVRKCSFIVRDNGDIPRKDASSIDVLRWRLPANLESLYLSTFAMVDHNAATWDLWGRQLQQSNTTMTELLLEDVDPFYGEAQDISVDEADILKAWAALPASLTAFATSYQWFDQVAPEHMHGLAARLPALNFIKIIEPVAYHESLANLAHFISAPGSHVSTLHLPLDLTLDDPDIWNMKADAFFFTRCLEHIDVDIDATQFDASDAKTPAMAAAIDELISRFHPKTSHMKVTLFTLRHQANSVTLHHSLADAMARHFPLARLSTRDGSGVFSVAAQN